MSSTISRKHNEVTITITASESDLAASVRDTYNRLRAGVNAQGFRPGRAPNNIIDRELGAERVQAEVIEAAAERMYRASLSEHAIHPVNHPHVEVKKFVPYTEAEFEITVEVMPEVTLGKYQQIKARKTTPEVDDAEVSEVLKSLQERLSKREPVERAAQSGDEVELDFHGRKDGKDVPGAQAEKYPLQLGSNRFIPGFEDEIIGLKAGDTKTFTITFPKEYGEASLAGTDVEFSVKVHSVSELTLPELDDDFAKQAGPFESLDNLKQDVRSHIQSEKDQATQRDFENAVVDEVVQKAKVDLPQTMLERERERLEADVMRNLSEQGLSLDDYLKQVQKTAKEHEKELDTNAQKRVKTALVLTKVAEAEELEVTPEELEIRLQLIAGQYQDEPIQEELKKPETRREIANQMLAEKTIARLVGYASEDTPETTSSSKTDQSDTKQ